MKATEEAVSSLPILTDLPLEEQVRSLVQYAQELIHQYYETDAPWSGPSWWLHFNQVGDHLRDTLEAARTCRASLHLNDQELERAYLTLIRVAYFFEPGGVAETFFKEQRWFEEQAIAKATADSRLKNAASLLSAWYTRLRAAIRGGLTLPARVRERTSETSDRVDDRDGHQAVHHPAQLEQRRHGDHLPGA